MLLSLAFACVCLSVMPGSLQAPCRLAAPVVPHRAGVPASQGAPSARRHSPEESEVLLRRIKLGFAAAGDQRMAVKDDEPAIGEARLEAPREVDFLGGIELLAKSA